MADNQRVQQRIRQYRSERRKFSCKVYIISVILIIISVAQWVAMMFFIKDKKEEEEKIKDHMPHIMYGCLGLLLLEMLVLTIFIFFEKVRFKFPINWLLAIIIVELLTLGLAAHMFSKDYLSIAIACAAAAVLWLLAVVIGGLSQHDFTLDVVVLFVAATVFFVGSVFIAAIYMSQMEQAKYFNVVYMSFVGLIVVMFIFYHAQTICGSRYAEMRLTDYLLAALIMYHDFVILAVVALTIYGAVKNETDGGGGGPTTEGKPSSEPEDNARAAVPLPRAREYGELSPPAGDDESDDYIPPQQDEELPQSDEEPPPSPQSDDEPTPPESNESPPQELDGEPPPSERGDEPPSAHDDGPPPPEPDEESPPDSGDESPQTNRSKARRTKDKPQKHSQPQNNNPNKPGRPPTQNYDDAEGEEEQEEPNDFDD